jgi:hypothetical protein
VYQEDYLFFPEAQTVDKLLSLFNIQSQEQLEPNKMITILGLLNLLNIVSVSEGDSPANLSSLVNNTQAAGGGNSGINSQQVNQLLQSLNNNQAQNNTNPAGEGVLDNNSAVSNVLNMLNTQGNNNNGTKGLDPSLLLKLMNLINQVRGGSGEEAQRQEEGAEENEPVKSEPYEQEEEE